MSANPFWEFSLDLYSRPEVAAACIGLQDEAGLDVNVLLFCIWSALEGTGRLDPEDLGRALSDSRDWQDKVVRPLRSARRSAKTLGGQGLFANSFRRDIAATELAAERVEQWLLYDAVSERRPGGLGQAEALAAACANVADLLRLVEADAPACRPRLEILLGAAFPPAEVASTLRRIFAP